MSNPEIIIVGAGSAGCLLAHLLAKDGTPVTLLEPPSTAAAEHRSTTARSMAAPVGQQ